MQSTVGTPMEGASGHFLDLSAGDGAYLYKDAPPIFEYESMYTISVRARMQRAASDVLPAC